jgi:hypothetical protein
MSDLNEEWVSAVAEKEANGVLTTAEPGKWAGKEVCEQVHRFTKRCF